MWETLNFLVADESGSTAVEYGLIAGLIAIAAITAMSAAGFSFRTMVQTVTSEIDGAIQSGGSSN